eukprot:jgi/Tetstr1/423293/TSEL_013992.t1
MDDDNFWADEENEEQVEQVGPGGGLVDRAVRGNNESTKDIDEEDEDEDEDGGNEDEGDEEDEGEGDEENGGYCTGMSHFTLPAATWRSAGLDRGPPLLPPSRPPEP